MDNFIKTSQYRASHKWSQYRQPSYSSSGGAHQSSRKTAMSPLFSRLTFVSLRGTGLFLITLATALAFANPVSAAPGDLYVSDLATNSIVVYKPDGSSSVFASGLNSPQGLVFDQEKNLFVADGGSGSIFKFTPDGLTRTTVATGLSNPAGITLNGFDLLVSENSGDQVTRVTPNGHLIPFHVSVTAPLGVLGASVDQFSSVYVAASNGTLKVTEDGTVTTVYAGGDGRCVAVDSSGNVFISLGIGQVQKFPAGGGLPTTFAAGLNDPFGMAFRPKRYNGDTDGVGNLFVADPLGGFIFQITPDGNKTTFASQGKPNYLVFEVGSTSVTPTPTPTPTATPSPSPTPGLLLNISTRGNVLTDDNVLIGGFIITGGTTNKTVVIRAIGPSLTAFGLQGVLADPLLELHLPDGTVITNDNWMDNTPADQAALVAAQLAPNNDLESAIFISLPPSDDAVPGSGLYTAIVRGNNGGTGVGLMEVYDLDNSLTTTSQLANISTRGRVGTGDDVMIGGFISGPGSGDGKVLLRAIGPSLADAGIPNPLQDPTLELFNGDGDSLAFNDNWQDTASDEIIATGLAPSDDAECAILTAQVAGSFTAIVRGANDTTGVALVEAYHISDSAPAK
jgi:glucose/arabinose dehydrogenase